LEYRNKNANINYQFPLTNHQMPLTTYNYPTYQHASKIIVNGFMKTV